ncbi:MAG: 50S ribosomal protein L28 [Chloroflexi bacterium]|nr:50S ribosomal protein L28 [Chloroflexota bacterium]
MAMCEVCGKTKQWGHNVSHSNRKTPRTWKPNVHKVSVYENGRRRRVVMCTRCLRTKAKATA